MIAINRHIGVFLVLIFATILSRASAGETAQTYRDWKVFDTDRHPKAGGLHMSIRYPPHWTSQEGRQPQAVQSFRGESREQGVVYATLLIGKETLPGFALDADSLDEDLLNDIAREHGGKVIESGHTTIDGIPAAWAVTRANTVSSGMHLDMKSLMYVIIHNRVWIQFQGSVGGPRGDRTIESRFEGYKKVLGDIAASIEFPSQRQSQDVVLDKSSPTANAFLKWYYTQASGTRLDEAGEYFDIDAIYNDLNRRHSLMRRTRRTREDIIKVLYTQFFNPYRDVDYTVTSIDTDRRDDGTTMYKYRLKIHAKRFVLAEDGKREIRELFASRRDAGRLMAQQFPYVPSQNFRSAATTITFLESLGSDSINVDSFIHQHFLVDNNTQKIRDWIRPELGPDSAFEEKATLLLSVSPR